MKCSRREYRMNISGKAELLEDARLDEALIGAQICPDNAIEVKQVT